MSANDQIARLADKLADQTRLEQEAIRGARVDWTRRWPNHCTACSGWGGFRIATFVACRALPVDTCHRCGADMNDSMCKVCKWRPGSDGLPVLPT